MLGFDVVAVPVADWLAKRDVCSVSLKLSGGVGAGVGWWMGWGRAGALVACQTEED